MFSEYSFLTAKRVLEYTSSPISIFTRIIDYSLLAQISQISLRIREILLSLFLEGMFFRLETFQAVP